MWFQSYRSWIRFSLRLAGSLPDFFHSQTNVIRLVDFQVLALEASMLFRSTTKFRGGGSKFGISDPSCWDPFDPYFLK